MATIRDVAKLAGVAVSTVSRVLNQSGYVNKDTAEKVYQAIEKLQYEPNVVARSLANKKTSTLALILPNSINPFFPELSRAVENVARMHGYTVLLCNADDHEGKVHAYMEVLRQNYVGGIVFATHMLEHRDAAYLKSHGIPFVVLDRGPNEQCSVIRAKNYDGALLAVKHLLEAGCRKIAHIYGPQDIMTARERLAGYVDSVKHFPWYTPTLTIPGDFQLQGGMKAAEALMERHPDVDGIFAGNDLMAVGALKTLLRSGVKVPDQVALCGFDGIDLTAAIEPEITTIAQPIYDMGAMATRLLIKKIEDNTVEEQIHELDVTLIPRASTQRRGEP